MRTIVLDLQDCIASLTNKNEVNSQSYWVLRWSVFLGLRWHIMMQQVRLAGYTSEMDRKSTKSEASMATGRKSVKSQKSQKPQKKIRTNAKLLGKIATGRMKEN